MNREPGARSDLECMRMCVEAVDMMLENQGRMTRALREIAADDDKDAKKSAA
jgi:hypothetical protein